jgi:hypothetical protein
LLIFEKQNTLAPLILTLESEGVGGITGQVPTIAIRRATTIDSYLDFQGYTFKSAGWLEKYEPMTEVESGDYTYFLNLNDINEIVIGDILSIEYYYDDNGVVRRDQETLLVVESILQIPTDTATLISVLGGNLTIDQANQLKEVWQILGLDPANPMIVSKTSRTAGAITQNIQKNVPIAGSIKVTRL